MLTSPSLLWSSSRFLGFLLVPLGILTGILSGTVLNGCNGCLELDDKGYVMIESAVIRVVGS